MPERAQRFFRVTSLVVSMAFETTACRQPTVEERLARLFRQGRSIDLPDADVVWLVAARTLHGERSLERFVAGEAILFNARMALHQMPGIEQLIRKCQSEADEHGEKCGDDGKRSHIISHPGCPVGENKDRRDVRQRQNGKECHEWHMHRTPLVERLHRHRIPEEFPVERVVRRSVDAELLLFQLRLASEFAHEMLPDMATCRHDHHKRRGGPGQQRVEMDSGMNQYQQCRDPARVAVKLEKAFDRPFRDDLFFARRIDEREKKKERSGNAEVPAGKFEPELMQQVVERNRGCDEQEVRNRQRECFPDQE